MKWERAGHLLPTSHFTPAIPPFHCSVERKRPADLSRLAAAPIPALCCCAILIWRLMLVGHCSASLLLSHLADSNASRSSYGNDDGRVYEANGETVCTIIRCAVHSAQNKAYVFTVLRIYSDKELKHKYEKTFKL